MIVFIYQWLKNAVFRRYVENVREHLQPGEFYHYVSRGKLLYYPQPAEQANLLQQRRQQAGDTTTEGGVGGIDAILAVEEKLVGLSGASRHTFEGVTFEHATWLRPGMGLGFVEAQSGAKNKTPSFLRHLRLNMIVFFRQARGRYSEG